VADESQKVSGRAVKALPNGGLIFIGFGIGVLYKTLMSGFKLWKDIPEKVFGPPLKAGSVSAEISPELLGVGYIIGPRISAIMAGGGVLSYLLLIPMIKFFGEGSSLILSPGTIPIGEMTVDDIRGAYILYIGAGAVAAGGLISLVRSLPIILHGIKSGLSDVRSGARNHATRSLRTRITRSLDGNGCSRLFVSVLAILAAPPLHMNIVVPWPLCCSAFCSSTVFFTAHGRNRVVVEPDLRHDRRRRCC